jgi:hypothetical protein
VGVGDVLEEQDVERKGHEGIVSGQLRVLQAPRRYLCFVWKRQDPEIGGPGETWLASKGDGITHWVTLVLNRGNAQQKRQTGNSRVLSVRSQDYNCFEYKDNLWSGCLLMAVRNSFANSTKLIGRVTILRCLIMIFR